MLLNGIEDADDKNQESSRRHLFKRCFPSAISINVSLPEGRCSLLDNGYLRRAAGEVIDALERSVQRNVGDDDVKATPDSPLFSTVY